MTKVRLDVDVEALRQQKFLFDRHNPNFTGNTEYNLFFLRANQNIANDLLRARGHIFLNDIFDWIGMPRTIEGAVTGWVLNFDAHSFVDFTFVDDDLSGAIAVSFNVQGVILDQIERAHDMSIAQFDTTRPH